MSENGPDEPQLSKLLTIEEVAERLHLSPETVRRFYVKQLPFFKLGRRLLLAEVDLARFIEERKGGGGA